MSAHGRTEYCANCEVALRHGGNSAKSILSTWTEDEESTGNPTPLSIYEALSVIFEIAPLRPVGGQMTKKKDVFNTLLGSKFRMNQGGGDGGHYFGLCFNCAEMLTVLYNSFQEFTSACKRGSDIGKILRELEKSKTEKDQSDSTDSNPKVKLEPQEVDYQDYDDEDLNNNPEFDAVSSREHPESPEDGQSDLDAGDRMPTSGSLHESELNFEANPFSKPKSSSTGLLYQCRKCRKEFLYETTLICHRRIIHQENIASIPPPTSVTKTADNFIPPTTLTGETSTCPICRQVVPRNNIRTHLSNHTRSPLKPWMCLVCGNEFRNQTELFGHAEEHKASIPCQNCGKTVPRLGMLVHIRLCFPTRMSRASVTISKSQNSSGIRWSCKLCDISFMRRDWMVAHMAKHMQSKRHMCKICDKKFDRSDLLRLHVKRFHRNNEGPPSVKPPTPAHIELVDIGDGDGDIDNVSLPDVPEPVSPRGIQSSSDNVQENSKSVIQPFKDHRFVCKGCQLEFSKCNELQNHLMETHADRNTLTCSICNRKLQDTFCLSLHLKSHSETKPFTCYICEKQYREKSNFFSHLTDKHDLEESLIVAKYPNIFITKSKFERRKLLQLKGEKLVKLAPKKGQFPCEVCGKVFPFMHAVNKHKKVVHDKVKEYICSYCGKSFARKSYFFIHERLHTSTETPYKCHLCGKGFRLPGNLRSHLKSTIHNSERNFVCDTCGKTFNRRDNLRLHIKCVHMKIPNKKARDRQSRYTSGGRRRVYGADLPFPPDTQSEASSSQTVSVTEGHITDDPLRYVTSIPNISHQPLQQNNISTPPHASFSQTDFTIQHSPQLGLSFPSYRR